MTMEMQKTQKRPWEVPLLTVSDDCSENQLSRRPLAENFDFTKKAENPTILRSCRKEAFEGVDRAQP